MPGIDKRPSIIKLYKPFVPHMIIVALARYTLKVHILEAIAFRTLILKAVEQVVIMATEILVIMRRAEHTVTLVRKAIILTLLTLCLFLARTMLNAWGRNNHPSGWGTWYLVLVPCHVPILTRSNM